MTTTNSQNSYYSPKLSNKDLIPAEQTWNWYQIFCFWMSDIHSLGGYIFAGSLFTLGIAPWQVFVALIIGITIVSICANLISKPSQQASVPYAVICRQSFGVFGAYFPIVVRGTIAIIWYGIQTWIASNSLKIVLLHFYPNLIEYTQFSFVGLDYIGWACFLFLWALQTALFCFGMETIKKFIDFCGPMVYVSMIALVLWVIYKAGWENIHFTLDTVNSVSFSEQFYIMLVAIALVVSYFSGPLLNFGDFSRYAKSNQQVKKGNFWGIIINFILFSLLVLITISGSAVILGKITYDPVEVMLKIDNTTAILLGVLTLIIATMGINVVANFVSASFDLSSCYPEKIDFKKGGFIAAVVSVLITPWNLYNSSELMHHNLQVLALFIGPIFGIILTDFYLVNKQKIHAKELFTASKTGAYWYSNGSNKKAITALLLTISIELVVYFTPIISKKFHIFENVLSNIAYISPFSWFIGVFLGFLFYYLLNQKNI